jgi:hypothetical protein|tara:strand:- start:36 stop:401 length:366 start_codon:yes stop_codon:yes gene_type:complete
MPSYTLYEEDGGEIRGIFHGNLLDAELNGPFIEGEYTSDEYTVVDGEAVRKDESVITSIKNSHDQIDIRNQRNNLLFESDWTQLSNSSVDSVVWESYRQLLRDLPIDTLNNDTVIWPTRPE